MTAIFRINQATTGTYGLARQDLELFSVGGTVTLEAQDTGHTTYTWEIVSAPEGFTGTITPIGSPATTATVDLDVTGGYIFRLTVDSTLVTEDMLGLYGGIPLPNSGLAIPAFNETVQDNSEAGGVYGYERKLTRLLKWTDANATGTLVHWDRTGTIVFPKVAGDTLQVSGATDDILLETDTDLLLTGGALIKMDDGNRAGWTQAYVTLSDAAGTEWADYKTKFGEVSLMNAIVQAGNSGAGFAGQTGRIAFGGANNYVDVSFTGFGHTNYTISVNIENTVGGTSDIFSYTLSDKADGSFRVNVSDTPTTDYSVHWIVIED